MELLERINLFLNEKESYEEFFRKKLEKYGVKSPSELSKEEKKKFFNEIDREWKAKKETD